MATFTAACYDVTGVMTMNETDRTSMMATISTLRADLAALQAEDVECSKADEGLPCGTANRAARRASAPVAAARATSSSARAPAPGAYQVPVRRVSAS